jgi:hypothetical protein
MSHSPQPAVTTCPRCGYERPPGDPAPASECPRCGVLYARWRARPSAPQPHPVSAGREPEEPDTWGAFLRGALFDVEPGVATTTVIGHAVVLLAMAVWGVRFAMMTPESNAAGASLLHLVDLVFHEAGHVLFRPFGSFMTILGGSLMQLLVPLSLAVAFVLKYRNPFAAAACLWWLGQSSLDLAPYIADARSQKLMLLGGVTGRDMPGIHDWDNILNYLEIIKYDREIALAAHWGGVALMGLAVVWGARVVAVERSRREDAPV